MRGTGGRERIVWLAEPVKLPGSRIMCLGFDLDIDLPEWLRTMPEAARLWRRGGRR
jgi:myo-inositol catabolism protein IolC